VIKKSQQMLIFRCRGSTCDDITFKVRQCLEFYFFIIFYIHFGNKYTIVSKFSKTNLPPSWLMAVWVTLFSKNYNFFVCIRMEVNFMRNL
jgi:hypothetical protein